MDSPINLIGSSQYFLNGKGDKMLENERTEEFLNLWKKEIRKIIKKQKLKVRIGKTNKLKASRIAYFVTECFFGALNTFNKKYELKTNVNNRNIEQVEPQVFNFAKISSLICEALPCEKPLKHNLPKRIIVPWSNKGFILVDLDSKLKEFLNDVFQSELEKK